MAFSKINFTINQLISADLFLGYHTSSWNVRINYFLLGKYNWTNVYNLNYTYFCLKRALNVLIDLMCRKGKVWVVNENFDLFFRNELLLSISKKLREIYFFSYKWYKGLLSNFRFVKAIYPKHFPHAIAVPNFSNNVYVVNEAAILNVPSFCLIDTSEDPTNAFYSIPANSKSIKSIIFFYLMIAKAAFYSKHISSSSFLFNSQKKIKWIFKSRFSKHLYGPYNKEFFDYVVWSYATLTKRLVAPLLGLGKMVYRGPRRLKRNLFVKFSTLKYLNTLLLGLSKFFKMELERFKKIYLIYKALLKLVLI